MKIVTRGRNSPAPPLDSKKRVNMNQNYITIKYNKKIIKSFIFLCLVVLLFIYGAITPPLDDDRYSKMFYQLGGIFFTIIFSPVLISYGKFVFTKNQRSF